MGYTRKAGIVVTSVLGTAVLGAAFVATAVTHKILQSTKIDELEFDARSISSLMPSLLTANNNFIGNGGSSVPDNFSPEGLALKLSECQAEAAMKAGISPAPTSMIRSLNVASYGGGSLSNPQIDFRTIDIESSNAQTEISFSSRDEGVSSLKISWAEVAEGGAGFTVKSSSIADQKVIQIANDLTLCMIPKMQ